MSQSEDAELRARFAELREHDRVSSPEFRVMRQRVEMRAQTTQRARVAVWMTAAASVLLAAGFIASRWRDRELTRLAAASSISTWRSPTAGLLRPPARELVAPRPILSSVLDGATRMQVQRKGDGS